MRHISKHAAFRARSLDSIKNYVNRIGLKTSDNLDDAIRGLYGRKGDSGSLFFDLGKGIAKRVPGLKRIGHGADKLIDKYQRGAVNLDLKAGGFVADKLKNTRARNLFVNKKTLRMQDLGPGKAVQHLEIEMPSMFAPIDKTKKAVLPIAGALYLSEKMNKSRGGIDANQASNKGGEDAVNKAGESRQQTIDKIAKILGNQPLATDELHTQTSDNGAVKLATLAARASEMLKQASLEIKTKQEQLDKIAEENRRLELTIIAKDRSERSVKLAEDMVDKGIVKVADFDTKVDEIMEMDDSAYNLLSETIGNIKKEASYNGVDSLTFIGGESIIKERATLADSIKNEVAK